MSKAITGCRLKHQRSLPRLSRACSHCWTWNREGKLPTGKTVCNPLILYCDHTRPFFDLGVVDPSPPDNIRSEQVTQPNIYLLLASQIIFWASLTLTRVTITMVAEGLLALLYRILSRPSLLLLAPVLLLHLALPLLPPLSSPPHPRLPSHTCPQSNIWKRKHNRSHLSVNS